MSDVGEEFRRRRLMRYRERNQEPPPWTRSSQVHLSSIRFPTAAELRSLAAAAVNDPHPLRALVEMGVLPVDRARRALKAAKR